MPLFSSMDATPGAVVTVVARPSDARLRPAAWQAVTLQQLRPQSSLPPDRRPP
jgi:hypothetical protein